MMYVRLFDCSGISFQFRDFFCGKHGPKWHKPDYFTRTALSQIVILCTGVVEKIVFIFPKKKERNKNQVMQSVTVKFQNAVAPCRMTSGRVRDPMFSLLCSRVRRTAHAWRILRSKNSLFTIRPYIHFNLEEEQKTANACVCFMLQMLKTNLETQKETKMGTNRPCVEFCVLLEIISIPAHAYRNCRN